jgi:hypothetical protein
MWPGLDVARDGTLTTSSLVGCRFFVTAFAGGFGDFRTIGCYGLHDYLLQSSRFVGSHLSIPVRAGALASAAHTSGMLDEKAVRIDREFHLCDAARVPSCHGAQGSLDAVSLHRYREACRSGVYLD